MFSLYSKSIFVVALVGLLSSIYVTAGSPRADTSRDPAFSACDVSKDNNTLNEYQVGQAWHQTDDINYYLTAGLGSCGKNYTDTEYAVCLAPGWLHSGNVNHCSAWVQVALDTTGVVATARVVDTCGAVANSTFGCNDMYVSKGLFRELAGAQADAAVDAGSLPAQIKWRFIAEPCHACYSGLTGFLPNGTVDACKGLDANGYLRCGRKTGAERIQEPYTAEVCNQKVTSCDHAKHPADKQPK